MPLLCFGRDDTGAQGPDAPAILAPTRRAAAGIKDLFLPVVQPVVVERATLVINLECISSHPAPEQPADAGQRGRPESLTSGGTMDGTRHPSRPPTTLAGPPTIVRTSTLHPNQVELLSPSHFARRSSFRTRATTAGGDGAQQGPGASAIDATASAGPSEAGQPLATQQQGSSSAGDASSAPSPNGAPRELRWTDSRRTLAQLVVKEQTMSAHDRSLANLSHPRRLADRLERLNLEELEMKGDGNCQFRTLAFGLYGNQEHHAAVRSRVIEHIWANREEFEPFLGDDFSAYMASMALSGTWGDELTLRAACDAYCTIINVVTSDAQNWFLTYEPHKENTEGGEVFATYIAPIHYNAIRRKPVLRTLSKQLGSSLRRLTSSGSGRFTTYNDTPPVSV